MYTCLHTLFIDSSLSAHRVGLSGLQLEVCFIWTLTEGPFFILTISK